MAMKVTSQSREYVIPPGGNYSSSIFSYAMSLVSVAGVLGILYSIFYGILYGLLTILQFRKYNAMYAEQEAAYNHEYLLYEKFPDKFSEPTAFRFKPIFYTDDGTAVLIDPIQNLRIAIFLLLTAVVLFYPLKKFFRVYGLRTVKVTQDGIKIKSIRSTYIPWDSILDIVVKKSSSIFAILSSRNQTITIYTMDNAYTIEGITIDRQQELAKRLKMFGESLEERVIDFGYGAQIAVIWRRMKRSKVGMLGMVLVVFFIFISLLSAVFMTIYPYNALENRFSEWTMFNYNKQWGLRNPNYLQPYAKDSPPNLTYWFGTDEIGRDMFSRIFFGSFYSILIGFIATILSVVLGGVIGATSGYMGGTFDNITMRIADVLMVLPGLPLLIMISATFSPLFVAINIEGAYYIVVFSIFALIGWSGTARYTRAEVLALKESEFIQAENVLGASHWRIVSKHILPNTMSTLIIIFTLGVAGSIQAVASLAFLGFGSQSTLVWGDDLARAAGNPDFIFKNVWWPLTYVSLALFLLTLGFNLMGDAFRDALDPKLKE